MSVIADVSLSQRSNVFLTVVVAVGENTLEQINGENKSVDSYT